MQPLRCGPEVQALGHGCCAGGEGIQRCEEGQAIAYP
jgi:hypothetical protein